MNITNKSITEINNGKTTRIHPHRKKDLKIDLELEWEEFAFNRIKMGTDKAFSTLFSNSPILLNMINSIPKSFYNAWKNNSRLSLADFESVTFERAWRIIEDYSPHGEWYLYEHLQKGIHQSCIDLLRQQGLTKKRINSHTAFHKAISPSEDNAMVNEIASLYNLENDVLSKAFIAHI